MRTLYNSMSVLLVTLFIVFSFSFVGCTKHPNEQQLQALEEQKNAALSAESALEEKRREKSRLESELNQTRQKLQDTKNELEAVKQRLAE